MTYSIRFVGDDDLPAGHDFVLVECRRGSVVVALRERAISPAVLEDAWAAYRAVRVLERPSRYALATSG